MFNVFCSLPFNKIKIEPNGDIKSCCYQGGVLGNLFTNNFDDIWSGRLATEIREATKNNELHSVCRGWGGCPFIIEDRKPVYEVDNFTNPLHIELDLPNTHCNIGGENPTPDTACIMCPRASPTFSPTPDRTLELVDKIRPLMPNIRSLCILGLAEPFWKDKLFEVLDSLNFNCYREKITFWTFSNATVFNPNRQRRFLDMVDKSELKFSVDAANEDTYIRIRRVGLFHQVEDNIKNYCRLIEGTKHKVSICNNVNLINIHEVEDMVTWTHKVGVKCLVLNPTHDGGGCVSEEAKKILVNQTCAPIFKKMQEKAEKRAQDLGIELQCFRPLDLGYNPKVIKRIAVL